jgi:hypothetical protein
MDPLTGMDRTEITTLGWLEIDLTALEHVPETSDELGQHVHQALMHVIQALATRQEEPER